MNQNDDIIMEEDISKNNINNENKRNNFLNSIESILVKALYLISESINRTLISLETNNNEGNIKTNLSKFITISNIFKNNIPHLNNEYYTVFIVFIIPIISTILAFTQYLIKFKES